jgi:uncharacterized protein YyaL (SSP411 family)
VQVVAMGASDDPDLAELRRAALAAPMPDLIVLTVSPDGALAAAHPVAGKSLIDGRATAYVCPGRRCLPPVTSPEQLSEALTPARLRETH